MTVTARLRALLPYTRTDCVTYLRKQLTALIEELEALDELFKPARDEDPQLAPSESVSRTGSEGSGEASPCSW